MGVESKEQIPKRKPTRHKEIDYSADGAYFITVCTQDRRPILSRIVGGEEARSHGHAPVGEGSPLPQLSQCGKIVDKWITALPTQYPEISVDSYVIMPNHIHLLLVLTKEDGRGDPSPTVSAVVGWLKYQITKEIHATQRKSGKKVFQRSFYDHVIRNYDDYYETKKYIAENPARWFYDELFAEEYDQNPVR